MIAACSIRSEAGRFVIDLSAQRWAAAGCQETVRFARGIPRRVAAQTDCVAT
jgi:hypothetical protein